MEIIRLDEQPPAKDDIKTKRRSTKLLEGRPQKRIKTLSGADNGASDEKSSISSSHDGVLLGNGADSHLLDGSEFTVNQDFARRFEHNKKREELQRLKEKYSAERSEKQKLDRDTESSTDSEDEDDAGFLASGALDAQFQETLEAIRKKNPCIYDKKTKFYAELEDASPIDLLQNSKKEKPMHLRDYHRIHLLEGGAATDNQKDVPISYAQQQDDLKTILVKEMHEATTGEAESGNEAQRDKTSGDDFLVMKPSRGLKTNAGVRTPARVLQAADVEAADKDPETFLSNFMSARAWVPSNGAQFQPFESDDDDEDRRAELFEEAYNLRFEDPKTSNEKLLSHARDAAAKYSVRKQEMNPRRKAREAERAKKDASKQIREMEKARLRKLKVAEAEEKINKIKDAAGFRGKVLQDEDWSAFLEESWDDDRWEQEMRKRFGEKYYTDNDPNGSDDNSVSVRRKLKKPKWADDIDISDLVPGFKDDEAGMSPTLLPDDDSTAGGVPLQEDDGGESNNGAPSSLNESKQKANSRRERNEQKKMVHKERRKIERVVDQQMKNDEILSNFDKKHGGVFRYRDTSPIAYGLTAQDILMASDSQLNQYAGLKKMAAFRDSDKKRKDKKHFGKKARLRQWRKETFGHEEGPQKTLSEILQGQEPLTDMSRPEKDRAAKVIEGKTKRTR